VLKARDAVLKMKEYHPPLSGRDGLRLDFNENTSGCSPRVMSKLRTIVEDQLTRYPEREPVEQKAAAFFGAKPSQLLLTNGVDEAIHLLCETFLEAGDEVIIPVPTFSMYELYAQQTGATVVTVQANANFAFPTAPLLSAISPRTKMIAIASPNNPTGAVISRADLIQILKSAPQAVVLLDEAYYDFYSITMISELSRFANLFIARTFSKAYGLAGFRAGVLLGNAAEMKLVRKVSSPYNVNGVVLACLEEAIGDTGYIEEYVRQVLAGRGQLQAELQRMGIKFWHSEANFVLMRIGERRLEFVNAMRERGILVRDRNNDPGCKGCVRITIGTLEQTGRLIQALREICAELILSNAVAGRGAQ
jgi:histidinol-phosphate aminotransferase